MKHLWTCLAASSLLTGCAGLGRVVEYGPTVRTEYTMVHIDGGRVFKVTPHPRDQTILVQVTVGRAAAAGFASGLTLGFAKIEDNAGTDGQYRAAADKWATSRGCTVLSLYRLDNVDREAKVDCPGGRIPR
jgi:hypothetical protein